MKSHRLFCWSSPLALGFSVMVVFFVYMGSAANAQESTDSKPFNFEKASRNVPKPREIWPHVSKHMVAPEFNIISDKIVSSDTDPAKKLRKITAHFFSQDKAF